MKRLIAPETYQTIGNHAATGGRPARPAAGWPAGAVAACRAITRRRAGTFYFGSLLLDAPRRAAVWAVYAACRDGDDLVDEPRRGTPAERRAALDGWWDCVRGAYAGRGGGGPVWAALAWAVAAYPIPLEAFAELYRGFRGDLDGDPPADLADLERYCRRVAGVVGLMVAPICGYEGGEETLARALRLGQAMQLTNILRDVGEDLGRGRLYLPAACLARHGLDRAALVRGRVTPEYRALMRELVALARAWYREAEPGIARLHGRAWPAVGVAARAYEGILDALERNGYDNFSRRAFVTGGRKLALAPGAIWRLRAAPPPLRP